MRSRVSRDVAESRTVLVLQGPTGCGKRALVRAAAVECKCACVEGTEVPGISILEGVAYVCERVLNARPLGGHSPNVFLFCGIDGMLCKSNSSRDAGKGAGAGTGTSQSLDGKLLARVLAATSAARSAPLVLTLCDFGTDELRQLRRDPRVCVVALGPVEHAAAARALGTVALRQHWPSHVIDSAMAVFQGDLRAALIHAQEAALGYVAVRATHEPPSTSGNQFDMARAILNARSVDLTTLAFRCASGAIDGLAQHCVFSSQFASVGRADLTVPTWLGMCTVAEGWSWYDACVPWNSDLRDALLLLPIAAVQQLRCATRTPPFNGKLLDDDGAGTGAGGGPKKRTRRGAMHPFDTNSDAWRLRGAEALHQAEVLTRYRVDTETPIVPLRTPWKALMTAKVSETPSATALALRSEPASKPSVVVATATAVVSCAPVLALPVVSSRDWW